MKINVGKNNYKVCDECGERFETHTPGITEAYINSTEDPYKTTHVCDKCANRIGVAVCSGCDRWSYKSTLNDEGLCVYCEAKVIALDYNPLYVNPKDIGDALVINHRNIGQIRMLCAVASRTETSLNLLVRDYYKGK